MIGKATSFTTAPIGSFAINSCWKLEKEGLKRDSDCQTSEELYQFDEAETQTATSADAGTQVSKVRSCLKYLRSYFFMTTKIFYAWQNCLLTFFVLDVLLLG